MWDSFPRRLAGIVAHLDSIPAGRLGSKRKVIPMKCMQAFTGELDRQFRLLQKAARDDHRQSQQGVEFEYNTNPHRLETRVNLLMADPEFKHRFLDDLYVAALAEIPRDSTFDTVYRMLKAVLGLHHEYLAAARKAYRRPQKLFYRDVLSDYFSAWNDLVQWVKSQTIQAASSAVYEGDGLFIVGEKSIRLEGEEEMVLESLVELRAATKTKLVNHSGVNNAVTVLRKIKLKHAALAEYITFPGGRGKGGYQTTITRAETI